MSLENILGMSIGAVMTPKGQLPVVLSAQRDEKLSPTGDYHTDRLKKVGHDFQYDLEQYYVSEFYKDFQKSAKELGYGKVTKFEDIEVNALLREAAAYVKPKEKRVGVSDKKNENFQNLADQIGVDIVSAMYLALSHEHIHSDTQDNKVFGKGRLYTEMDAEAKLYSVLIDMAIKNPKNISTYATLADGVAQRYGQLNQLYARQTGTDSGLLEKYVSNVDIPRRSCC